MPSFQLVCSNIPNVHRCIRYTYVDSARAAPVDTLENRAQLTSAERKAEFEQLRAEYEEEQQRREEERKQQFEQEQAKYEAERNPEPKF